jgi:hypothetical protein
LPRWSTALVVATIVLVNLACKLPGLDRQSLWLDEALTVAVGARPVGEIVAYASRNQNPPLYAVVMHGWLGAFGSSEASVRMFPVFCSTLTAVVLFLLARRFLGMRAAILAAILFTGANVHVQYAREARVYALVSLLCTASMYVFLTLVTRPRWRTAGLLAAVNALLFHCHYVTVFVPVAQVIAVLTHRPWRVHAGRHVLAAAGGSGLLAFPWVPIAWGNAPRVGAYWLEAPTWRDLRDVLKRFAAERRILYLALLLLVPAVRRALGVPRAAFDRGLASYLALAAFVPIGLAFVIATRVPIFLDRYLLYASLGVILLLAYLLALLPVGARGQAVLALGLLALVAPRTLREREKDDWRGLAAAIRAHHDVHAPGTSVVLIAPNEIPPFAYYYDREALNGPDTIARLRARGIVAVERAEDVDAETFARARLVTVVQTRISAPDVTGLAGVGFEAPRSRAKLQGLEILAGERVR